MNEEDLLEIDSNGAYHYKGGTIVMPIESYNDLLGEIEDYDRIFDIWNKRTLIYKFNKEYSKKVVKEERAKGRKIAGAIPDAEYVYKKYYELNDIREKAIEIIESYNLGKYDYSIPPGGITDLLDLLRGKDE